MRMTRKATTLGALTLACALCGCGLHGARAEFIRTEADYYIFKSWQGRELRLKADDRTRKEPDLKPGDQVQLYYSDEGLVQFIVRP